ncbi:MAG: hypothetical protein AABW81_03405 [Nanoarchaeota archaeon]
MKKQYPVITSESLEKYLNSGVRIKRKRRGYSGRLLKKDDEFYIDVSRRITKEITTNNHMLKILNSDLIRLNNKNTYHEFKNSF